MTDAYEDEDYKKPCLHCDGRGWVTDYCAIDVTLGENVVPETTKQVQCHFCFGKGKQYEPHEENPSA